MSSLEYMEARWSAEYCSLEEILNFYSNFEVLFQFLRVGNILMQILQNVQHLCEQALEPSYINLFNSLKMMMKTVPLISNIEINIWIICLLPFLTNYFYLILKDSEALNKQKVNNEIRLICSTTKTMKFLPKNSCLGIIW